MDYGNEVELLELVLNNASRSTAKVEMECEAIFERIKRTSFWLKVYSH